jgi:hypothetical protein
MLLSRDVVRIGEREPTFMQRSVVVFVRMSRDGCALVGE